MINMLRAPLRHCGRHFAKMPSAKSLCAGGTSPPDPRLHYASAALLLFVYKLLKVNEKKDYGGRHRMESHVSTQKRGILRAQRATPNLGWKLITLRTHSRRPSPGAARQPFAFNEVRVPPDRERQSFHLPVPVDPIPARLCK